MSGSFPATVHVDLLEITRYSSGRRNPIVIDAARCTRKNPPIFAVDTHAHSGPTNCTTTRRFNVGLVYGRRGVTCNGMASDGAESLAIDRSCGPIVPRLIPRKVAQS